MTALEVLEKVARVLSYLVSILTFLTLVIKPIRNWVIGKVIQITHKEEVEELSKGFNEFKKWVKEEMTEMKQMLFENERDRLKGELFNYGNKCRRGKALTLEEFRYIQEVYQKYSCTLHCNHNGTEEYEYIRNYFESPYNKELIEK